MMTEPIHSSALGHRLARRGTPPLRQLWQVPMFFTGVLALFLVAAVHPFLGSTNERQAARALADARQALEPPQPNPDEALVHAERALRLAAPMSHQAAEAHFLIGSAYLVLGDQLAEEPHADTWAKACDHLEQAERLGVPDADKARVAYRLGLAYLHGGGDPQRVVDRLSWSVAEGAEDPFAGYGELAQAYLRLPKPDLHGALEATRKQLALPTANEAALAAPRLQCGELLVKLERPDEARKVLDRIETSAPPDVLFRARFLRARLLQDEGSWAEALGLWEAVRNDPRWVTVDPAKLLYSLGLCYRKLGKSTEAIATWEAARLRGGDEGQAAALGVAELRLAGDNPSATLEAFEAALRGVTGPDDYHNQIVDLRAVRNLFENACQALRRAHAFEAAQQLAQMYERVALPGAGQELAAQSAEAWGQALREQGRASTGDAAKRLEEEARQHYRQAGLAYEAAASAAAQNHNDKGQADHLWHSSTDYLDGRDQVRAVAVLERLVRLPISLELQGRVWFALGEAQAELHERDGAQAAFQKCIEYPGPYAYRARYELAVAMIEQKNWEDAEAHLKQNLSLMQATPDPQAQEKTLITLADLLYQRGNYQAAILRLQEAIDHYPENPRSRQLRVELAQTCRRLADQLGTSPIGPLSVSETREHVRAQRTKYLELALEQYQKLVTDLDALKARSTLVGEQEALLRQSRFAAADCQFDLGRYAPALEVYADLARLYQNQVEGLLALRHIWQCHGMLFQPDQSRQTLDRIRSTIPSTTFDGAAENRTRAYWENWVSEQSRLREPTRSPSNRPQ